MKEDRSSRGSIPRIPHINAPIGNLSIIPSLAPPSVPPLQNLPGTASADQTNTTNWGGLYITAPGGRSFYRVSGTFQVPTPQPPTSGPGTWWGAAWVGIDLGTGAENGLLQTGVDWAVQVDNTGNEVYGYWGWYEWFPTAWQDYDDDLDIWPGDVIELAVQADSASQGTTYLNDVTGQQSYNETLTAPSPASHLQLQTADWIVEDFTEGGSNVLFANFGTVQFFDCLALSVDLGGGLGAIISLTVSAITSVLSTSTATIANLLDRTGRSVITETSHDASSVTVRYI